MNEVMAIAGSVWLRILKMKVVYFLVGCAIMEISVTGLYEVLMVSEHRMLMVDLSLLLTTVSGLLVVLSVAFDIPREMRDGSAAVLLSKPVGRPQYLIGKFLGIAGMAVLVSVFISIGFCGVHTYNFGYLPTSALQGHVLAVLSVIPMSAIALFFAALLNEAPASILTAASVWFSHSAPALEKYRIFYGGVVPDMNFFNLRAEATHNIQIDGIYLALAAAWAVVYSIGVIGFASLIFNARDLK